MNSAREDNQPWPAQFSEELESPFVDEQFFAGEGDGFGARLAALEAASPFQAESELDWAWLEQPEPSEVDAFTDEVFSESETGISAGDNRVRVQTTDGIPWRWICKIKVTDSKGRHAGAGTGVLVSERHILTAAHVVHRRYLDPVNYSIEVIPALNHADEPFGSYAVSAKPKIPGRYDPKSKDPLEYDYALLALNERIGAQSFSRLGKKPLCFWGHSACGAPTFFQRLDPQTLNGKAVYTAGYPGQKGGLQLWCAAGILTGAHVQTRTMYITADTTKGQSGSPVWMLENGRYFLVGIAVGGGSQINRVVLVTRELIRQVRAWISADGDTPSMVVTEAPSEPAEFEARFGDETAFEQEDEETLDAYPSHLVTAEEFEEDELEAAEWETIEKEDEVFADEAFSEAELDAEAFTAPGSPDAGGEIADESDFSEGQWLDGEDEANLPAESYFVEEETLDEGLIFDEQEAEFYQAVFESAQDPAVPAAVAEFAVTFGKEWSQRRNGDPPPDKMTQWLLEDYQDTLAGARLRYKDQFNKGNFTVDAISRAWVVSRQENMKFQLLSSGFKMLANFHPPKTSAPLVASSLVKNSDKAPVAPLVVQFIQELRQRYPAFGVSTYRGHGGGDFLDRGYSVDIFLRGRDSRGFYPVDEAVKFLRQLHAAAGAVNADWRVIYNDFSAAKIINQETGQCRVIFAGKARKVNNEVTGIKWHGPDPLILHFHLDLVPGSSSSASQPTRPSITPAPTPTAGLGKPLAELVRFAQRVLNAAEGERLNDDGDLGRYMRGALERFRQKYSLGTGGVLDGNTEIALVQRALEETRQQSLFGQFGVFDSATRSALLDFKSRRGLPANYAIDAAVRTALTNTLFKNPLKPSTAPTQQSTAASSKVSKKGGGWGGWRGRQTTHTVRIQPGDLKDKYDLAVAVAANVETGGYFDKVQMYDKGILSWGIKQWTLHRGSLQKLLAFIKNKLVESGKLPVWTQSFPGLDISGSRIIVNGVTYPTPDRDDDSADLALRKVFRGSEHADRFDEKLMDRWLDLFALAGRQPDIQKLQFEYAEVSLRNNLNRSLGDVLRARREISAADVRNYRSVSAYLEDTPLAITLFNGMETQNPKYTYLYLKKVVDHFATRYKDNDPARWPAGWQTLFAEELKKHFEASGVACWGKRAIETKSACKDRTSRTEKIMKAFRELSPILG